MSESTGDNTRKVLRMMRWGERRMLIVGLTARLRDEPAGDPLGFLLEAVLYDAYLAEDEELALRAEVDG